MFVTIDEINKRISDEDFIERSENQFRDNIRHIADGIISNRFTKPIVLLSGPSGSGKTTTAMLIERELDRRGVETHTISLDNYFKTFSDEEKELLRKDLIDLESPDRVNAELLNRQLMDIINCRAVDIPRYDFAKSESVFGRHFQRKAGELVIIEGIHALNPSVISLPDESTDKIYVSVRTRIKKGNELLHPSYIRLMRRVLRDTTQRDRSPEETIRLYPSVELGEKRYIMPYKHRADYSVDTFLPYEVSVYRNDIMKLTTGKTADMLKDFVKDLKPIEASAVPTDSLIREFIGKGEFSY